MWDGRRMSPINLASTWVSQRRAVELCLEGGNICLRFILLTPASQTALAHDSPPCSSRWECLETRSFHSPLYLSCVLLRSYHFVFFSLGETGCCSLQSHPTSSKTSFIVFSLIASKSPTLQLLILCQQTSSSLMQCKDEHILFEPCYHPLKLRWYWSPSSY